MRLITGDECGILKECIPALAMKDATSSNLTAEPSSFVTTKESSIHRINPIEHASRRHGVVALAWNEPSRDDRFSSLHVDGVVELWERTCVENAKKKRPSFGKYRHAGSLANIFGNTDEGGNSHRLLDPLSRPMGLSRLSQKDRNLLCACNHAGKVVVLNPDSDFFDTPLLSSFDTFPAKSSSSPPHKSKNIYPRVSVMSVDEPTGRIAVGGKERDTVLFDLETSKPIWKAKNLPPDARTLLQPQVWPTAILFLQQDTFGANNNIMAVGTAYGQVRLYDVRVGSMPQRRPIRVTPTGFLEYRVTSLCEIKSSGNHAHEIVAGDAAGFVHAIDLRKIPQAAERVKTCLAKREQVGTHGRFVGPTGSIRQIVQKNNRMAVVGLDRMLRIYDTNKKRKELISFYLKQRLNCVLVGQEEHEADDHDDVVVYQQGENIRADMDQEDVVDDYVDSDASSGDDSDSEDDSDDHSEEDSDKIVQGRKKQRR